MDSSHPEFLNWLNRVVLKPTGARFHPEAIFPAKGPLREAAPFDSGFPSSLEASSEARPSRASQFTKYCLTDIEICQ
jgi:hypothetical protein